MPSLKWYHAALLGSGAAGLGALFYYLMREDTDEKSTSYTTSSSSENTEKKSSGDTKITKEHVYLVIKQIMESQDTMKGIMRNLNEDLLHKPLTFIEVYEKVRQVEPEDPLEKNNLTMLEFDKLLEQHNNDPIVQEGIAKIMGGPAFPTITEKIADISPKDLIKIHEFMVEKMSEFIQQFSQLPNKETYAVKTSTIALQAMVSVEVEKHFGLNFEDIEAAVLVNQSVLSMDQDFAALNCRMQNLLSELFGYLK